MEESLNFHRAVKQLQGGKDAPRLAQTLLQHLTKDEKLGLLHGDPPFWKGFSHLFGGEYTKRPYSHGKLDRMGIPGVQYCDGPRGVNINQATVFPCSTARGATWDTALEESVARAIGREARAYGANCVGSVCVNLPRHPAWGRVQETYGEDPLLLGEFGTAHVRGLQENVMACVKHFALNSMETARFRVNVSIDACALHEVYLPHFKQCIEAGALSIMTAYNSINGEWAGESVALIRNILRERWSFSGIVITDWLFGLRDGVKSVKADLDIECPFQNRRQTSLRPALESGEISWSDIDRIASRIIQTQLTFYANRQSVEPERAVVFGREHPSRDIRAAVEAARKSEVAIVMVGYDGDDEGEFLKPSWENDGEALALLPQPDGSPEAQRVVEGRAKAADVSHRPQAGTGARPEDDLASRPVGGDRRSVRLAPEDVELIRAVVKTNPRTIVSIITAGAVIIEEWHDIVPSILIHWYNGCENGRALADILAGRSNPSGHLPWSMPRTEVHLPSFDPDANQVTYDKWFGQRMLDKMGVKAAYPLGFGLSYTTFEVECIDFDTSSLDETFSLQVGARVRNTGSRLGHCVVQIYGCPDLGPGQHDFPNRLLAGFQVVELSGQETKWVQVKTSLAPFRRWEEGDLRLTARSILFQVGQYAGDQKSLSYRFHPRGAEARL
uniref:beta-glucosidase n=1 Tax=Fusarium oxysporum (strain Fo5176) TaxID=660025 RepID=A0A0D2YG12_FUSOF